MFRSAISLKIGKLYLIFLDVAVLQDKTLEAPPTPSGGSRPGDG
jgi:hypothetical protein